MRVTYLTTQCGPDGNIYPGMVANVTADQGKWLIENHYAREYDRDRDKGAAVGPVKAGKDE